MKIVTVLFLALIGIVNVVEAQNGFKDDFKWTILNNDPDYYSFNGDYLNLRTNSGDLWEYRTDYKNLFLIDNPIDGDFNATLTVSRFVPESLAYAQIDIIVYDDDDNHVRGEYGFWEGERRLGVATEINQTYTPISPLVPVYDFGENPFYLRLNKTGDLYTFYFSIDGINFIKHADSFSYGDGSPAKLGFIAMVDPSESSVAQIDSFEVSPVPEPSAMFLFVSGLIFLLKAKNRKHK